MTDFTRDTPKRETPNRALTRHTARSHTTRLTRGHCSSGSMKSWIGPRAVESIRGRGNLASRGLIRSRLGPGVAGSSRSRLDPALGRLDPLAACAGGGRANPFTA